MWAINIFLFLFLEHLPDISGPSSSTLNTAFLQAEPQSVPMRQIPSRPKIDNPMSNVFPNYDSSQDTILSEIVNKIRDDANDRTESDEDLCLAEIAKSLNNKIFNSDEFSNDGTSSAVELSQTFVANNNFSALVTTLDEPPTIEQNVTTETTAVQEEEEDEEEIVKPVKELPKTDSFERDSPLNEFIDMDDNTNTELVDMDLEDTMSVYTSFSMDTSITVNGKNGSKKKKRHRKSILCKSSRKGRKQDDQFLYPAESHFCNICNKMFRSHAGLATHKTTLTHISKLSEQEFLRSKLDGAAPAESEETPSVTVQPPAPSPPPPSSTLEPHSPDRKFEEDKPTDTVDIIEPLSEQQDLSKIETAIEEKLPTIVPRIATPVIQTSYLPQSSGIEPISSPEQMDYNTDRYKSRSNTHLLPDNRLALSQEERLFYECCSMLKGSDRPPPTNTNTSKYYPLMSRISTSEMTTKPVTPKSNEQYSYVVPEGSKHSKGIPKIDLNQFSDISSDSNPAYSCPQIPSSSETQNIFLREQQMKNDNLFTASGYQTNTSSNSIIVTTTTTTYEKSSNHLYDTDRVVSSSKSPSNCVYSGNNYINDSRFQSASTNNDHFDNIDRNTSSYQLTNYSAFGQKSTTTFEHEHQRNRQELFDAENAKSYMNR